MPFSRLRSPFSRCFALEAQHGINRAAKSASPSGAENSLSNLLEHSLHGNGFRVTRKNKKVPQSNTHEKNGSSGKKLGMKAGSIGLERWCERHRPLSTSAGIGQAMASS
jgi:hypothetical protein